MRTTIDLTELVTYSYCPERERRRRFDPNAGLSPLEVKYRSNLRKVLVAFYTEMADGRVMTEAELRRRWSTLWEVPISSLTTRAFAKRSASTLNSLMTDDERMIMRGTKAINKLAERRMNSSISVLVVDEPFSLTVDGLTITGRHDLVFEDHRGQRWIVDWTDQDVKIEPKYYLKHTLLSEGFHRQYGQPAGVLIDYLLTLGDYIEPSVRHPYIQQEQLKEAGALAASVSHQHIYRRIGSWCGKCPYKSACLGVKKDVPPKRPPGRPRKHPLPLAKTVRKSV
jgi:hypothetical protein